MANNNQMTDFALRIDELQQEIVQITNQIQPALDHIKVLKKELTELKTAIVVPMAATEIKTLKCDSVNIKRAVRKVMPAFKPATIEDALRAFFREIGVSVDAKDAIAFIDKYRKSNKVESEKVTLLKHKAGKGNDDNEEMDITTAPPAPTAEATVKPFGF